jgi:hypothetical protein
MDKDNLPTTTSTQLPDAAGRIADLLGGLVNIQNSIAETGGIASGLPFLSINSNGVWYHGQDRTEVEEGSHWAIDIRTWKHGYIAWPGQQAKERKPLGEKMVPASSKLPDLATLPDVGQPYQLQFAFELLCMSGADAGVVALYKNGSYGAKVIVQDLVERVRAQARIDQTRLCPVVVLDIRSYEHKEWKKTIYNPVLQIQKWISFEDYDGFEQVAPVAQTEELSAPQPKPVPQPEPEVAARGNGRRTAAPQPAPEPARPIPMPTGRRPGRRAQPAA